VWHTGLVVAWLAWAFRRQSTSNLNPGGGQEACIGTHIGESRKVDSTSERNLNIQSTSSTLPNCTTSGSNILTYDCRPVTVRGELGSVTLQMTVQGSSGPADLPRCFSMGGYLVLSPQRFSSRTQSISPSNSCSRVRNWCGPSATKPCLAGHEPKRCEHMVHQLA
jgi:hypothetical protein